MNIPPSETPATTSQSPDLRLMDAVRCHESGNVGAAEALYRLLLAEYPFVSAASFNLGTILMDRRSYEESELCFREALAYEPNLFAAQLNLAFVIQEQGRFSEAMDIYSELIREHSDIPEAEFNRATLQLLTGNPECGWQGYEQRFFTISPVIRYHDSIPDWTGALQNGLRLLVCLDQGYGDAIMMARYLPLLLDAGIELWIESPRPLQRLFSSFSGISGCIVRGDELPEVDARIHIMSLPGRMKTTLATIPPVVPFASDARSITFFGSLLKDTVGLKIGLCLSGRLDLLVNRKRSCPESLISPLLEIRGVTFVSLQKDIPLSDPRVVDLSEYLQDFSDTAALVENLDLVITIDTAVAHLSGTMGKPTWLMLPFVPDWRWLLQREDSPWYPAMRLFRQKSRDEWEELISKIRHELQVLLHNSAAALSRQGMAHDARDTFEEALSCYRAAISYDDTIAVIHHNMGNSLKNLGRVEDAEHSYQKALSLDPHIPEAWHNLAIIHQERGDREAAHRCIEKALEIRPGFADALHTLGEIYLADNRTQDAVDTFQKALQAFPSSARSWNSLGIAFQNAEKDVQAEVCYRNALTFDPTHLHARNNLGAVLLTLGRIEESISELEQLLNMAPAYYDGHWNLSCSLIAVGALERGWAEFEYRFLKHTPVEEPHDTIPRWDGGSPLNGKTILLTGEQAFGDTIQFVRFAPLLGQRGARVVLECQAPPLVPLMAGAVGVDAVICRGDELPECDFRLPLLSLPHMLNIRMEDLASAVPYLRVEQERISRWRSLTGDTTSLRVGLCWWGRQTLRNQRRSCPPALLAPLAEVEGVVLYRLQVGNEAPVPPFDLIDYTPDINDFADTAALIHSLDLIITIDTSVAHLAGALGKPVWLMLPTAIDWRWMKGRDDSPWYPGMRIFRQQQESGWDAVVASIAEALREITPAEPVSCEPAQRTVDELIAEGDAYRQQELWEEAHATYNKVLLREPDHSVALLRAGGSLIFLNRHGEAETCFRRAVERIPDDPDPHINLAICHLAAGRWQEGWREFEWRRRYIFESLPPLPQLEPLSANSRLDRCTVLVHSEQGFGDMLQFCRYLPLLAETGARVLFSAPSELVRLCQTLGSGVEIIPHGELLPLADYQTLLLSLPGLLQALHPLPLGRLHYLSATPDLADSWEYTLRSIPGFRIGIAWQGRNIGKSGYRRSLDRETLAPLLETPGCSFVTLQPEQLLHPHPSLFDVSSCISDFADTAALMANLDLIITVDTAVAHLAGALGVPCWTLLLHLPDWRWFPLDSARNIWYPEMRLYRQTVPGDWQGVVRQVVSELQQVK